MSASISNRKLRANRKNARKSTGPRTDEGKLRAARNAIVHGVYCADDFLLPGESRSIFLFKREEMIRCYQPQDAVELMLVERIVMSRWKIDRLNKLQQQQHLDHIEVIQNRSANHVRRLESFMQDQLEDETIDFSRWYKDMPHFKIQEDEEDKDQDQSDISNSTSQELIKDLAGNINWMNRSKEGLQNTPWVQMDQMKHKGNFDQFEKFNRMEQRLENSIYRAMRELANHRKMKQSRKRHEDEDEDFIPQASPYLTRTSKLMEEVDEEVERNEQYNEEEKQRRENIQNEPTVKKLAASLDESETSDTDESAFDMTNRDIEARGNAHGVAEDPQEDQTGG